MKKYTYLLLSLFSLTLSSTSLTLAQLNADFTADQISGCRPLVVSFSDLSTNAVSWTWDYSVGSSTVQNPSAFFSLPGTYDVRLIVTDINGNTDTLIKEDYISVYEFPTADFSVDQATICANDVVQFSDLSTANSGQLTSWTWDFGNGKTSTDQNPSISYPEAGSFPVSLLVSNEYGCTDNVIRPALINVSAPDVSFSGDNLLACGAPHTVNFSSEGDLTGNHLWLFGDGTSSTDVNPTHTYNSDGSFSVSHIITDLDGCVDTLRKDNYVGIGVNTLTASVVDSSICVNDTAFFVSNAPSNSNILWDFGNGQIDSIANPAVRYTSPGTYNVTAIVSDASGCNYNFAVTVEVSAYPNVSFTVADTTLGCSVPFQVDFINNTVGAVSYLWTFGDGNFSTLENPSHTFTEVDSFTVTLIATGPTGCRAQIHPKDYIKIQEVETGFFAEPRQGCAPLDVVFQDTTHSPYPIIDWQWDFGNGNTGNGYTTNNTYPNTGEFNVSLITTNTRGCKDTLVVDEYIQSGTFPNMDFTVATDSSCALTEIQFTNLTQGAQDFVWFFGDGDTSQAENPTHGFLALGDMDVTLVASDRGCADTLTKTAFVHIKAPLPVIAKNAARLCYLPDSVTLYNLSEQADWSYWTFPDSSTSTDLITRYTFYETGQQYFYLTAGNDSTGCIVTAQDSVVANDIKSRFVPDQTAGCVPFTVSFQDSSINAIEWKWFFGNGDSSILQNPTYTFTEPGDYDVMLVVKNSFLCRDTLIYKSVRALGPDADFQITSGTNGCVPFDLSVQDMSTGTNAITGWDWDFGDGMNSNVQNPVHTYASPDLFTISLTVTDADGCQDSVRKSDVAFITQPIPNFAVNPPTNCLDVNSTFISLASGSGLFYTWDFGDGNTSHLANTFHSYADTGFYDITLHVVDVNGCDSSITKPNFVEIQELKANFWADTLDAPCPPLTVNFRADNSFPHIGVKWRWDFGNGATSSEVFPTHIYNTPGSYDVSLILESPEGCIDTMIVENMINIQGPVSSFSYTPEDGCLGTEVLFTVDTVKEDISYEWLFGDGSQSTLDTVSYTYSSPGMYFPILVAKDTLGCEVFTANSDPIEIYSPPSIDFTADNQTICDAGNVQFQDLSSVPNSVIRSWKWYFGDGDSSDQKNPLHFYQGLGSYDVTLVVESNEGCIDSLTMNNFIEVVSSPSPGIVLDTDEGCAPLLVNFEGNFKPYPGQINDWSWDLGDGNQFLGQMGSHTFNDTGMFIVSLDVVDNNGCVASTQDTLNVYAYPSFDFTVDAFEGCAPFVSSFNSISNDPINQWLWDFGDGTTDTSVNPVHTYTSDGVFSVSLTATNIYGCQSILTKDDLIILSHPISDFNISESAICTGGSIYFEDESYGNFNITSWQWDFGDGNSSSLSDPLHTYSQGGVYDVSLIISDINGCSDTLVVPNAVTVISDSLPEGVALTHVSVQSDTEVQLNYEVYNNTKKDFKAYMIYREDALGNFSLIDSVENLNQLDYTDQGLNTLQQVYCYKVAVKNQCLNTSLLSDLDEHCSIDIKSQSTGDQIYISWNPYQGWPLLDSYKLYRVSGYGMSDAQLIASLSSSDTAYVDSSNLCEGAFSYRIEAIGPGGYISYSDTTLAFANPADLTEVSNVVNATVENDAFISLEFNVADIKNASSLIIERDEGNGFTEIASEPITGQSGKFQDQKADVHNKPYTYRAFTADSCGTKTPVGQTAKSVHASANQAGNSIRLTWNAYEGWDNGVESYKIQRFDDASQSYIEIQEVMGGITEFEDLSPLGGNTLNCYRIIAVELDGNQMISVSNSNCVGLDPIMFTATGFTPNGDGVNDVFKVTVSFVDSYQMTIYNRWGKVVFRTDNPQISWDGRTQSGELAPEGVYLYSVTGYGKRGKFVQNNGSVSLIR